MVLFDAGFFDKFACSGMAAGYYTRRKGIA
jgi:hypothetical protein